MAIQHDLNDLNTLTPIELRRWYVRNIVLSPDNRALVSALTPSTALTMAARGRGASPEHSGIASRIIYEVMGRTSDILTFPSLNRPKTFNEIPHMTNIILWAFEPWKQWRYDPRSETVVHLLPTGQWAFHLKGKDSEQFITREVQYMIDQLGTLGFTEIVRALAEQGHISLDLNEYNMEASEFTTALNACDAFFRKFCDRAGAIKDVIAQLCCCPIMYFDTSTVNSIQNLVAVGNGVIPTDDFIDITDTGDNMTLAAGKLIPADPEFCLSSASGLSWPDFETFNDLMDYRYRIHHGLAAEGWDEWMDTARQVADWILTNKCPTYKGFLDHAFPANPVPAERDAFLRVLSAACFGTNLKLVAAMIGKANAGKDTVLKWLSYILGEGQVGLLSQTALTANTDDQRAFAPLKGARVAVVSGEVGEGRTNAILAEKVKSITSGGSLLTVAEKYEKPTTIFFDGMLIMQGNSVPQIQGGDEALYRNRLVAVEFKHPFPKRANTFEREYRREAPWFLQVLFISYMDYQWRGGGMDGIDPPQEWQNFSSEIELGADPLAIIDACITKPSKGIEIQSPTFYRALSILADRQLGIRYPISAQRWSQRLKRAGVDTRQVSGNEWRSKVKRADYTGWLMHFTLDADKSDGFFTQQDWQHALEQAAMSSI